MSTSEGQMIKERGKRKTRTGRVVSDVMDKTVVVEVRDAAAHPTYGKIVRRNKRLKAHDEANDAHVGDTVRITVLRDGQKTELRATLQAGSQ